MNYSNSPRRGELYIPGRKLAGFILGGLLIFILVLAASQATEVVEPGHRGVRVTLGKVAPVFEHEGLVVKPPFITRIHQVSIRQQTEEMASELYSSDLQQVNVRLRVLYRVPEGSVVSLFQFYDGDPFTTLIAPRVVEALKEVASTQSAEMIVQNRETIKLEALELTRKKIGAHAESGPIVAIEDLTISDLALSPELNTAIEQKMTQREEAERAKFVQRQAEIEAQTVIIKARGDGEAISIRGKALRENPAFIQLQIVEKWDGISPLVVGGDDSKVMLPISELENRRP
ncbi:MAG TPA: prohibitin family protein [Verrucomicrobiae bacterium]|nr:prohibitin family protein [Verrucomicrobiae bacterium]